MALFFILGVENDAGPSRDSAILEVERREKPQIEVYPSDNQTVVQGGSVLFQCRILSGIPNPQVEWKFNGNANSFDKVRIFWEGHKIWKKSST